MEDWRAVNSDSYLPREPKHSALESHIDDLLEKEAELEALVDERTEALDSAKCDLEYVRYQIEEAQSGEAV